MLAPGLSEQAIDELSSGLPFELPAELRSWWAWHDGAALPPGWDRPYDPRSIGVGSYRLLSLSEAVAAYHENREIHPPPTEPWDLPDLYWHEGWLPIVTFDASRVYADCGAAGDDGTVPIGAVDEEWDNFDTLWAASLAEAVSLWARALEAGVYRWNAGLTQWDWNHAAAMEMGLNGLL